MDLNAIRQELAERYPQWAPLLSTVAFREAPTLEPADNDGRTIYYNARRMKYYTPAAQTFLVAQQMLHVQLAHDQRGAGKDKALWRRASDAVVNAMLRADGFTLPEDSYLRPEAETLSAEALYELLLAEAPRPEEDPDREDAETEETEDVRPDELDQSAGDKTQARARQIEDPGLAAAVAGLREMLEPTMDLDFDWFPGETIRHGVLGYDFRPYPVARAEILLDTSASVAEELLRAFVRGVKALLQDAVVRVGCFDTQFYGFQEIRSEEDIDRLELRGSGGTNFNAAISAFSGDAENQIIFTDGYAEMPSQRCDAVWVVYSSSPISPKGGRVLYVKPKEEKEKHEIEFLIT
ncbi:MAG: hypothetical protein IJ594_05280 [Oscillospiraceae bacterium]|nr:hypothetical protein [Oscillospiraceae bacterium]